MKRILAMLVLAAMALPVAAMKDVIGADKKTQLLYVVSAMSGQYADGVLDLSGVPSILYFSDRPLRLAGHMSVAEFAQQWAGKLDRIAADPPNAAFSVLEETAEDVVVEILSVTLREGGLRLNIRVLDGVMPVQFTSSSLFIDPVQVSYPGVY